MEHFGLIYQERSFRVEIGISNIAQYLHLSLGVRMDVVVISRNHVIHSPCAFRTHCVDVQLGHTERASPCC